MKKNAFTLLETIIVIVIIGTLAGLVLPRFSNGMETTRGLEAMSVIDALRGAMERCALENNNSYSGCRVWTADGTPTINTLDIDDPHQNNNKKFWYYAEGRFPGYNSYSVIAVRKSTPATPYDGDSIHFGFGFDPASATILNDDQPYWDASAIYQSLTP